MTAGTFDALPREIAGAPANPCKLTECQGRPRCSACAAMDAAYRAPQRSPSLFPTNRIRWAVDGRSDAHPVLQQAYVDRESGVTDWRDVETVVLP